MIDHDIDVKKGIEYVKRALEIEPKAAYYLDSLAWGYFKLNECEKAAKIMEEIENMGESDNEEIAEHIKAIKECVKKQKGK